MSKFVKLYPLSQSTHRALPKPAFWRIKELDPAWVTNQFCRYLQCDKDAYAYSSDGKLRGRSSIWPWRGVRLAELASGRSGALLELLDENDECVATVRVVVRKPGIFVPCAVPALDVGRWLDAVNAWMRDNDRIPSIGVYDTHRDGFHAYASSLYNRAEARLAGPHPGCWRPRGLDDLWAVPACWPLARHEEHDATIRVRCYGNADAVRKLPTINDMWLWLDEPELHADEAITNRLAELLSV